MLTTSTRLVNLAVSRKVGQNNLIIGIFFPTLSNGLADTYWIGPDKRRNFQSLVWVGTFTLLQLSMKTRPFSETLCSVWNSGTSIVSLKKHRGTQNRLCYWTISIFSSPLNHKKWYNVSHAQRMAYYDKKLLFGGNCAPHCKDERKALYILTNFLCCHSFLATALKDYSHTEAIFIRALQTL